MQFPFEHLVLHNKQRKNGSENTVYSLILKIPFYGRPLKTDGRPRPVLSSPFLSPRAHPG